ncbi:MAG: T9SS type A sorting domain-containing protein, partial [Bacteroidota bacterium]
RRDDGTWTQLLDVEANYLAFSPDGTLYLASDQGISTYDGTTLTPGDATGLPASFRVNDMEFSGEGTLYVLAPGSLYTYDTTTGFTARTEVTSPLHIAAHPDGKLYVVDNFGQIGYYDNGAFTNRAITGVFTSNVGLVDFDISSDGIFWGSQQGIRPGVVRYDGTTASTPLAPGDLVDDAILIGPLTAASGGRVFVGSDLQPGIAVIQDPTTSIFSTSTPTLSLGIYPNPVRDRTQIRLVAPRTGTAALRLLDVTGRPLFTETLRVVAGEFTHELSLKNLATGVYFVEMSFGEQRALGRLQKQ